MSLIHKRVVLRHGSLIRVKCAGSKRTIRSMAKNTNLLRLYDLSKGAEIHNMSVRIDGIKPSQEVIIRFDHVDGMYSYNEVLDLDRGKLSTTSGEPAIVHIANTTILKKVDDHYVVASEKEIKNFKG